MAPPVKSLRIWRSWIGMIAVATLLLVTGAKPAAAQQQPTDPAASPVEYSLLQPGIAGKYFVVTVEDFTMWIGLGGHQNSLRSNSLRDLVVKEGYDASSILAVALQAELAAAGYRTEVEPVPRARDGQPQRLSRSDLPTSPAGLFLLDVVIDSIGLAAPSNGYAWQPAFQLSWRVMRPSGEIVIPTNVFVHGPYTKDGEKLSETKCALPNFNATMKQPQALWDCFDLGLREASRALVPLIRQKQDVALHGKQKQAATDPKAKAAARPPCGKVRRPRDLLDTECEPN